MTTMYKRIVAIFFFFLCVEIGYGKPLRYLHGDRTFVLNETEIEYVVTCSGIVMPKDSRGRALEESRIRVQCIDMIGLYIMYNALSKEERKSKRNFQHFVETTPYHAFCEVKANATFEKSANNTVVAIISCRKKDYIIADSRD